MLRNKETRFIIGMVNYKSSVYMETQFKIYRDFAGESFKIIVIDNSMNDEELRCLQQIAGEFSIPIDVIPLTPSGRYDSAAHGEGLQYIYELICKKEKSTKYFITQDPDFFWVYPNFLTYLKEKLEDSVVVGAPYPSTDEAGWSGHPWFPAAWGAAYRVDNLRKIKVDFRWRPKKSGGFKDVGWQIRRDLCGLPYYYFQQEPLELPDGVGEYAFGSSLGRSRHYLDNNRSIAYHLRHGTFEMPADKGVQLARGGKKEQQQLKEALPPQEWQDNRKKICEFFWQEINNATKRTI